jgi:hypothetical protein
MDAVVAKARATGKFDYDAPVEGLQVVDRFTRIKLNYPWSTCRQPDGVGSAPSRARSSKRTVTAAVGRWQIPWAPVRMSQGLAPWAADRGRDQSGISRHPFVETIPRTTTNARRAARLCPSSDASSCHHGRKQSTRAGVREGELDYLDVPTDLVPNVMEPNNTLKPRFAKAGVMLERRPAVDHVYVLQHGGPGGRRLHE